MGLLYRPDRVRGMPLIASNSTICVATTEVIPYRMSSLLKDLAAEG